MAIRNYEPTLTGMRIAYHVNEDDGGVWFKVIAPAWNKGVEGPFCKHLLEKYKIAYFRSMMDDCHIVCPQTDEDADKILTDLVDYIVYDERV
jgi:hypothetical protein